MNVQFAIQKDINRICLNISAAKDRQRPEILDGISVLWKLMKTVFVCNAQNA